MPSSSFPAVVLPQTPKQCRPIGMIHVHSTSALINHNMANLMDIKIPTKRDNEVISSRIQDVFEPALNGILRENALLRNAIGTDLDYSSIICRHPCRSLIFLLRRDNESIKNALEEIESLTFIQSLIQRALKEAEILTSKGIDVLEVENIAAPYFIGNDLPWEEVLILYFVAMRIRKAYPNLAMGVHILSCGELEVLPIAIACGAFFVRSEATLFEGVRPEGRVKNQSNLARFMYVRRLCRQIFVQTDYKEDTPIALQFPQIWSDLHKKHTHFDASVDSMKPWFENIGFCKLEGCIITGDHTGSNVNLEDLCAARKAIDDYKKFIADKIIPFSKTSDVKQVKDILGKDSKAPFLPLVTGSGGTFKEYAAAGADYIIVGTALKEGPFWENHVDANAVENVLAQIAEGEKIRQQ